MKSQIDFQETGGVPHCLPKRQQSSTLPSNAIKKQVASGQKSQNAYRERQRSGVLTSPRLAVAVIIFNIIYIMRIIISVQRLTAPVHSAQPSPYQASQLTRILISRVCSKLSFWIKSPAFAQLLARPKDCSCSDSMESASLCRSERFCTR